MTGFRVVGSTWLSEDARERIGRLGRGVAPVLSIAVLAAALIQLWRLDWSAVGAMVPRDPGFWLVFAAMYFAPVVGDWLIYRRLWGLPATGMVALARKLVSNELLMGYSGEAFLAAWARGRGIKGSVAVAQVSDVAILSAVAGAVTTIAIALAAVPFAATFGLHVSPVLVAGSLLLIAVPPTLTVAVRCRLAPVSVREAGPVAMIHLARIVATIGLLALLWHLALPAVALGGWLVFAALRQMLARLPVPNKDVVFAGLTVTVLGRHGDVAALMSMMAVLAVATHVVVGLVATVLGTVRTGGMLVARARTV